MMDDIKAIPVESPGWKIITSALPEDGFSVWNGLIFTSFDGITRYSPGVWEQQPPPRQPDARRVGGEV